MAGGNEWLRRNPQERVKDSQLSNRAVRREIERLLWGRYLGLDLTVHTPEEVERNVADNNSFYTQHALAEGKVLYERPACTSSRDAPGMGTLRVTTQPGEERDADFHDLN